ncbi:MAG: hypothetical protein QOE03_3911 [Micromonosporaceae bacterium]|jgi:hypothetical protein|nr:hypothetical protein [Micromonosporaceae bacterium]
MRGIRGSRMTVEAVTPRIDSQRRCRCTAVIVWDEVYGWLHAGAPADGCPIPHPVG